MSAHIAVLPLLDRALGGRDDLRVLDVGCGDGELLQPLSAYGEVYGLDSSPEMVQRCHAGGFAKVRLGSVRALPVETGTVDLLTLLDTLGPEDDDVRALRECRRALAPGGLIALSVPAHRPFATDRGRRYTARELRAKLHAAELQETTLSHIGLLDATAAVESRLLERFSLPLGRSIIALAVPR